ncbi:PH domain-containing protein [Rummeliibacillus pycnus]|uniref:PH domain-containing protein n=1 Tax=Rummeliibacillus pycnus TaxID=101070 RepID=UPI0037C61C0E
MKFTSKNDWWLTVIVWTAMLFSICSGGYAIIKETPSLGELLLTMTLTFLLPILILWLWLTTFYLLEEDNLIIRYGPFKKIIPFESIKSIKKTMNPLSSPALSLKRLDIEYGQYQNVVISPKDRDEFMEILSKRCPNAKITIQ